MHLGARTAADSRADCIGVSRVPERRLGRTGTTSRGGWGEGVGKGRTPSGRRGAGTAFWWCCGPLRVVRRSVAGAEWLVGGTGGPAVVLVSVSGVTGQLCLLLRLELVVGVVVRRL